MKMFGFIGKGTTIASNTQKKTAARRAAAMSAPFRISVRKEI